MSGWQGWVSTMTTTGGVCREHDGQFVVIIVVNLSLHLQLPLSTSYGFKMQNSDTVN